MKHCSILFLALSFLAPCSSLHALSFGQIDTFQNGTTNNWSGSGILPVTNIASGGPGGVNDRFLQVASDGSGAAGKLVTFNRAQWLGDYIATGVTAIEVDLRNQGSITLSIRLAFKATSNFGAPGYLSANSFSIAPSSGWQHAIFLITPATMTAIGGPAAFNTFFAGPGEFRIINEAGAADLNGDNVTSQLGIDNIRAVPEPTVVALIAVGLFTICRLRRVR